MKTFTAGASLQPDFANSGGAGVIQVKHDGANNIFLHGSVNGTNFAFIKEYTADTIEEVILAPFLRISGSQTNSENTSVGTSAAYLSETRGG